MLKACFLNLGIRLGFLVEPDLGLERVESWMLPGQGTSGNAGHGSAFR
jgi:hypothetical protein